MARSKIDLTVYELDYIARKIIACQKENTILRDIFSGQVTQPEINIVEEAILDALTELEI